MAKLLDLSVYGPGHISNILQVDASVYAKAFVTDGGKDTQVVRGDGTLASISSLYVGNAATATNAPWSGITGKPTTFTPSAHTHAASDVSGLPTSLKNPYKLTFGSKTYDGSAAATITASDLGALTSITKSMVEGVLTGDITSHTHSYLPLTGGTLTSASPPLYINRINGYSSITYQVEGSTVGVLGFNPNGDLITRPNFQSNANYYNIIHSNNYNSYAPTLTGTGASGTWGISITGNAATATNADKLDGLDSSNFVRNKGTTSTDTESMDANNVWYNSVKHDYRWTNTPAINSIASLLDLTYSPDWRSQIFVMHTNKTYVAIRSRYNGTTWGNWRELAFTDSNITGNAASATKLQTPRTIWGQSFDGTGNVSGDLNVGASKLYWNGDTEGSFISSIGMTHMTYEMRSGHSFCVGGDEILRIRKYGDYNLEVNGSANATTLYENGTRVALSGHTHTKSQITDFPSSMPASDVYAWAKASTKPTYTAAEVGAVPINKSNIVYTNVANIYMRGTTPTYYRIVLPDNALSIWNMMNIEIFVRQSYSNETGGKILINTHNNGNNTWTDLNATVFGNLTTGIKVYGSGGKYIYIGGCSSWSTLNIDKILIGDNATNVDLSGITVDYVTSLPSGYQTATMYYSYHTGNLTKVSQLTNDAGYKTTDTNTWRPVTNTYTGSDQSTCVSQYGTNALYNALVNGYASSAGSASSVPWSGVTSKPVLPVYYNLSGNDAYSILKNNATSFARNQLVHAYLAHGSASFAMGWVLSGYDSTPYCAFIVNSYGENWYLVGSSSGNWTNRILLHSGNIGSYALTSLPSHTHTKSQITDFPSSLPASDVYSWAKASTKPTYTAAEVGAAAASHTHNYAGSSSAGGAATSVVVTNSNANSTYRMVWHSGNSLYSTDNIYCNPSTDSIYASAFYETSDERLKDFENNVNVDLNLIRFIPKMYFRWKKNPNKLQIGTSAQAVKQIYPELVSSSEDGILSVDYSKLSIVALSAIDKLHLENQDLKREINILKQEIEKLKGQI